MKMDPVLLLALFGFAIAIGSLIYFKIVQKKRPK
jgi:hypothetical protein